jgi:two-component system, chemotaxis family, protein-glutamate methylesterase/glutaminase
MSVPTAKPAGHAGLPQALVVGASAGGIEALGRLIPALPADLAPPVIIVVHLPQENPTRLVEIFAPRCAVAVREPADKEPVEAGTVYFAPSNYHLLIEVERSFALSVDEPVNYARPAIDVLFESAARAYRADLVGIVLTGANADGARGLAQIRSAGGRAWVQNPDEAIADTMPRAALAVAGADEVLTLDQMRQKWARLGRVPKDKN